jgi:putative DNA primase/helicase
MLYELNMPLESPLHQPDSGEHGLLAGVHKKQIPQELFSYPQWICWQYVDVNRGAGKKPTKQPINPRTLGSAGSTWPNTWTSFEQAYATYRQHSLSGIGFVLTPNDPFVGLDIDHCVHEGTPSSQAQAIINHLQSYTEYSPSGAGLRILVVCPTFGRNVRQSRLEVYAQSRFLTLTGHHLLDTPTTITAVGAEQLQALLPQAEEREKSPTAKPTGSKLDTGDSQALWERIFHHDAYGSDHLRRFGGDTSLDWEDHSLTVLRLLNTLARWTGGNAPRMREMMLMSPLANEKWFSKRGTRDWLDYQIEDALRYVKRRQEK